MKLQIMSDLHIAHWKHYLGVNYWQQEFPELTRTDADVLILAGDIVDWRPDRVQWSVDRLNEFGVRYKKVLFVCGNHEYYGTSISEGNDLLEESKSKIFGVEVLQPGTIVDIEGHRFLGGVMWQPRKDLPGQISGKINDHYTIKKFATEHYQEFERFRRFVDKELKHGDIVVTHHAPSWGSIDDQWKGNDCNRWFVTPEMEPLILERKPRLWVHGHMHTPFNYVLGETQIVCNPFGYPGEGVKFDPKLLVEV